MELQSGSSAESFRRSLDSQRALFHDQIDQLQRIVAAQCQLTGVNPLAQEMAAGALSIKIGKRPRDLLNPKAVKYMQSIFSIKDAVSKKECREISALFGVTVTQVREFFTSQRSRVRKLVSSSREKAVRSNTLLEIHEEIPKCSDPLVPISLVPLNTVDPTKAEESPSCQTEDVVLPGIEDIDKEFVDTIFSLMRKEENFSGQVELMEWILRIQNSAVLCWFLNEGGTMILATWLSQAAAEEQTSVLLVILNVMCHLPLNKALPVHMSAILQSVNRLRFYKISDISNRARVLLSKWSKSLVKSQALKKPNGVKSSTNAQEEQILKQSLSDVFADESWHSSIDTPENILCSSEDFWKSESAQVLKLLPASLDDANKKNILGLSPSQTKGRRKVQLVEQPGQKTAGRSPQATRAAPSNQSRPISADDIQKAKMRAQFMQSKYQKASVSNENKKLKTELLNKPSTSLAVPAPKVLVQPKVEEKLKPVPPIPRSPIPMDYSHNVNPKVELKETLWEKCGMVQISWQTPPEVKLNHPWRVGTGENSKELEIQRNRNRREKETVYRTVQEIPPNPKEPWDSEMDYDDTLTPSIPAEQIPEVDVIADTQVARNHGVNDVATRGASSERENGVVSSSRVSNVSTAEPDLELLAVLLKNPELVIALTSGQAANLSAAETVKLLDMIKAGGTGNANNFNAKQVEEKVEVSLPSPTPTSNPGTSGWRQEAARNPFSQAHRAATSVTTNQIPAIHHDARPVPQYSLPPQVTGLAHEKYSSLGGSVQQRNSLTSSTTAQTNNLYTPSNNVKPPHVSSNSNSFIDSEERFHISNHALPGPTYPEVAGKPSSDFWRARQGLPPPDHSNSLPNQINIRYTNNAASLAGPENLPPRMPAGPRWEGNGGGNYESWSPDNSPTRNREYAMMGRDVPEPRMGYRPDQPRVRSFSNSSYRDYDERYGNRKWRDRRQ